jgi:GH24 family phage-related lysozyme (muramidase)
MAIDIRKMLIFDEGKKLNAYHCSQGFLTVGIGHNLNADPALTLLNRHVKLNEAITDAECTALFDQDLAKVMQGIRQRISYFDALAEKYQVVIINMVFQMGIDGVLAFKNTLQAMRRDDVTAVVLGIEHSLYYKQTPVRAMRMIKLVQGLIVEVYQ